MKTASRFGVAGLSIAAGAFFAGRYLWGDPPSWLISLAHILWPTFSFGKVALGLSDVSELYLSWIFAVLTNGFIYACIGAVIHWIRMKTRP